MRQKKIKQLRREAREKDFDPTTGFGKKLMREVKRTITRQHIKK